MSRRQIVLSEDKKAYEQKLNGLLDKYSKVLFVTIDNVRSQQIHDVRRDLRGKGLLAMGKKTLQRKVVENRATRKNASQNDKVFRDKSEELSLLRNNTGLLFTNADVNEILAILEKHRVQAPARVGAIAPCDVLISAGNTGMEPTMTSFFQALSIATKITKGTVEIISDKKVLSTGDRVDNSTAALLQKLKISPFYYKMEVKSMWDRGVVFETEDLKITEDIVESMLTTGIQNISALSLGAGIPTDSSFPIVTLEAFRNLLAASIATTYNFPEFNASETIKNAREGKVISAAPAAAPAAAAPVAAGKAPVKKAPEPEPEPEDDDDFSLGGMF